MHSFVIPLMTLPPQHCKELAESKFRFPVRQFHEIFNNLPIMSRVRLIAIDRTLDSYCLTGASLTETVFMSQRVN